MTSWQSLALVCVFVLLLLGMILNMVFRAKQRKMRDFTRTIETLLKPREEIKVCCPTKEGRWVLTNQRLLLELKSGFLAIPVNKIKKIKAVDANGKATTAADKVRAFTISWDQEYSIREKSPEFTKLYRELKALWNRKKPKKKS